MVQGSCNCKSVKFEVIGEVKKVVNCHCNFCRKMNGSAFSTYAAVLQSEFRLVAGKVESYGVSETARKHFCKICGTPIYNTNPKYAGLNIVHIGTLDGASSYRPDVNIYGESKVDWLSAISDIPTFDQGMS
ncbi:GFA family protein [Vibrio campbellii]|uniref:GFA family protein n=1 Tax=Vibrio campbellii TaxID=680 RepID=UPI00015430D0|nr:glutathione-dependent formaldehyde-activating, GFA [Vibrio campbellii HY01]